MLFNCGKVLLICAPSSSGKSLLANLICESDLAFVKLNTKSIDEKTRKEISLKYFSNELESANRYSNEPIQTLMQLFQVTQNTHNKNLKAICNDVWNKEKSLGETYCFEHLYKNYFSGAQDIIKKGMNCVIDHNIFLDPFPKRKNIFLEYFAYFKQSFKILNLYNPIENTLLNVLERNKRFYSFVLDHISGQEAETGIRIQETNKGYSSSTFRQPLRLLENWASMYNIASTEPLDAQTIQQISGVDFQRLLDIAHYEQEKLIGFLCFKNYPIAHIPVHELITFKDRYHYLSELSKSPILYVNEKRFEYDYKIAVDNDFNTNIKFNTKYKQIKALLKKWPMNKQSYDLRAQKETDSMKNLLQDKEREINTQKNCFLSSMIFKDVFSNKTKSSNYCVIQSFSDSEQTLKILRDTIEDVLENKRKKEIFYPISLQHYACATLVLLNEEIIRINMNYSSSKEIYKYDNNLILLGKLHALSSSEFNRKVDLVM